MFSEYIMARHINKKINIDKTPPADPLDDSGDYITVPENPTVQDAHNTGYLNPLRPKSELDGATVKKPDQ
jgi:hypothetical protein